MRINLPHVLNVFDMHPRRIHWPTRPRVSKSPFWRLPSSWFHHQIQSHLPTLLQKWTILGLSVVISNKKRRMGHDFWFGHFSENLLEMIHFSSTVYKAVVLHFPDSLSLTAIKSSNNTPQSSQLPTTATYSCSYWQLKPRFKSAQQLFQFILL